MNQQINPLDDIPSVQVYRSDGLLKKANIPDLLICHNSNYQAVVSSDVLYFTKDGDYVRMYCRDKESHIIDNDISHLWEKIEHRDIFHRVSNNLIVNSMHIMSISRNGQKLIFLRNGEELALEEYLFRNLMSSMAVV